MNNNTCYLLIVEIGEEGIFDLNGAIKYYSYEGFPFTKVIGVVPKDYDLEHLARNVHRAIYNQQYDGLMEHNRLIAAAKQAGKESEVAKYCKGRDEVLAHMVDCVVYDHKICRRPGFVPKKLVSEWVIRHPFAALTPWDDYALYRYFLLKVVEVEVASSSHHFTANDIYNFDIESYMPL